MTKFTYKIIIFVVIVTISIFSTLRADASGFKIENSRHIEDTTKQKSIDKTPKLSKRQQRRLDKLMKRYNIDTVSHSEAYYDSLKIANPFKYVVDYMAKDKDKFHEVDLDSLSRTFFTDTLVVSGGVMSSFNSASAISNVIKLDSMINTKMLIDKKMQNILGLKKDTMSLSRTTIISLIVPGFAQYKNKDYWKIPMLYAGVGGFAALGVMSGKRVESAQSAYNQAVIDKLPEIDINALHKEYSSVKTEQMIYYAGAAATYLYFLADGIYNFEGKAKAPSKATWLGLFIPGGGQIYNKSYWKLPIYYGGLTALAYVWSFNSKGFKRYDTAYTLVADGDANTIDEFNGRYTADQLIDVRDQFRRMKDMAIFYTCGFYLLGIVEAYVDASFKSYDISDNLAFKITPTIKQAPISTSTNLWNNSMVGVSIDFRLTNR